MADIRVDCIIATCILVLRVKGAQQVPLLKVLEDGYLNTSLSPWQENLRIAKGVHPSEFTICFWINPFRYLESNFIVGWNSPSIHSSLTSVMLFDGSIVVKTFNCLFDFMIHPPIREWTHICSTNSEGNSLFVNGKWADTKKCAFNNLITGWDTEQEEILLEIGQKQSGGTPFSGYLADIRLFWRNLSSTDILGVYRIDNSQSDFISIPSDLSGNENSCVKLSSISKEELQLDPPPFLLQYFTERFSYHKAEETCRKFQGSLPSLEIHGSDILTRVISEFNNASKVHVDFIWLLKNDSYCQIGKYVSKTSGIIKEFEHCNSTSHTYFCVIKKGVSFWLIGFGDKKIAFFPVTTKIATFENNRNLRLYYNESRKFYVEDVIKNQVLYYSRVSSISKLVGRHMWYKPEDEKIEKRITFSGCGENEFTCSDGFCVNIRNACDLRSDCSDESDELNCDIGMDFVSSYNKMNPALSSQNFSTKLSLTFSIRRIVTVDVTTNTIDFTVILALSWMDPRLRFKFLRPNRAVPISSEMAEKYWQPDILVMGTSIFYFSQLSPRKFPGTMTAFTNSNGTIQNIESYEAIVFSGNEVVLKHSKNEFLTLICIMNLLYFPFDAQTCRFALDLVNNTESDETWNPEEIYVIDNQTYSLSLYQIEYFHLNRIAPKQITFELKLVHRYGAFLFNIFLPCVLLQIIGILSHLLPLDDYESRIAVILSCLIVMASLFTQISTTLPPSASPKLIDIWMFCHVLMLLEVFVFQIWVIATNERDFRINFGKAQQNNRWKNESQQRWIQKSARNGTPGNENAKRSVERNHEFQREAWNQQYNGDDPARFAAKWANYFGFCVSIISYSTFLLVFILAAAKVF